MNCRLLIILLGLLLCVTAGGDNSAPPDKADLRAGNLLIIGGHPVTVLRAKVYDFSPAERVHHIKERLKNITDQNVWGPITTEKRTDGTYVFIGGHFAFLLAPEDCDKTAGENIDNAVQQVVKNLDTALKEEQRIHSWPYIIEESLWAIGGTLLLFIFIYCGNWLLRRITRLLERTETRILASIKVKGYRLLDHLVKLTRALVNLLAWILLPAAIFCWITFELHCLPSTRLWGVKITAYLKDQLATLGANTVSAIPNVLIVVMIIVVISFLASFVKMFFKEVSEQSINISILAPELAKPTSNIVICVLWILALTMSYPYLPGSSSDAFKGITILAGVIISLGSANIFAQLMAGITLMYSRAFKAGDFIQVGEIVGEVLSIGYLSTKIRTIKDEEINIPNAILLSSSSKNYTNSARDNGLLTQVKISIGYNTPWRQVHRLLVTAAGKIEGIADTPAPYVLQVELGDFYVVYELNLRLRKLEGRRQVMSQLFAQIQDEFNAEGVQIMSPHYVSDPPEPVVIPPAQWNK